MKKFLSVILACAMIASLSGCGSAGTSSTASDAGAADTAVTDSAVSSTAEAPGTPAAAATATAEAPAETGAETASALPVAMKSDLISAALQEKLGMEADAADAAAEKCSRC